MDFNIFRIFNIFCYITADLQNMLQVRKARLQNSKLLSQNVASEPLFTQNDVISLPFDRF